MRRGGLTHGSPQAVRRGQSLLSHVAAAREPATEFKFHEDTSRLVVHNGGVSPTSKRRGTEFDHFRRVGRHLVLGSGGAASGEVAAGIRKSVVGGWRAVKEPVLAT